MTTEHSAQSTSVGELERKFREAVARTGGTHEVEDIWNGVRDGQFVAWFGKQSIIITEFIEYPRKKTLHYFIVAGDLDEVLAMQPGIEALARAHGCTSMTSAGRAGWKPVLQKHGWEPNWQMMTKELA